MDRGHVWLLIMMDRAALGLLLFSCFFLSTYLQ